MEWAVRLLFKLILLVVAVAMVFSFVRQLISPVRQPVVMAGPGTGRLPAPMPKGGISPATHLSNAKPTPPPAAPDPLDHSVKSAIAPISAEPVDSSTPITQAIHDQILYRIVAATGQGNRLTIRVEVLNNGIDRLIEISSLPWSKTLFYNERGEAYVPQEVSIANTRANAGKTRAMLVSGVPAQILLFYNDLPMMSGNLAFRRVALMQLDVALFSTDQAYRNFFAEPLAISRPTFRLLTITALEASGSPQ
jgi:hypothetical protein